VSEPPAEAKATGEVRGSLAEVGGYFFRLGVIAFGGPAAHIALMRRELVSQRRWVADGEFLDMLGVTSLIPGPNSTEMTMFLGAKRAGWWGLWLAGASFILPAVAMVLALAWAYVEYGDTPAGEALLTGVQPVILAVIVQAIWGLRSAAVKNPATAAVVVLVAAMAVAGFDELVLLLGAGALAGAVHLATGGRASAWPGALRRAWASLRSRMARLGRYTVVPAAFLQANAETSLLTLFLVFLKIGGVLYGSGYVLVSFLEGEFVEGRGWLTEEELVDAVAVGQFTPGPVFTTATFVGYLVEGVPGAILATVAIFLPSFLLVALTYRLVPRLRQSRWAAPLLDGVNAAALALMAVVVIQLAREASDSVFQAVLLALAALVLLRFNPNSALLVLGGAAAGISHGLLT
jgi:chromate transporter